MSTAGVLSDWERSVSVTLSVHVKSGSELTSTPYPGEDRVVLHVVGTNSAQLDLYARRADLTRLIAAASAALDALDAASR